MGNRRGHWRIWGIILLSLAVSMGLCGCDTTSTQQEEAVAAEDSHQEEPLSVTEESEKDEETSTEPEQEQTETEQTETEQTAAAEPMQSVTVSPEDLPAYNGAPYVTVNDNSPYFTEEEKASAEAFEYYSDLDDLGRCGTAYANVCVELMPTEERGEIGQIRPSGWHTVKYNGVVDGNYLYNIYKE